MFPNVWPHLRSEEIKEIFLYFATKKNQENHRIQTSRFELQESWKEFL